MDFYKKTNERMILLDLNHYAQLLNIANSTNPNFNATVSTPISIVQDNATLTFTIINKNIQVPINMSDILVQGDKQSRKIHFVMGRYFDGNDLSDKDILIKYINAQNESGYDGVDDVLIKDDLIEFNWWVPSEVTVLDGKVTLQLELLNTNESGDIVYRFQTVPIKIEIEKTIIVDSSANPVDYYLDIHFMNQFSDNIDYNMASTFAPISINNRTIVMPALDDFIVSKDSRSKIITFVIQRYIDTIDLSEKTPIIKYKLSNGTGDRSYVCNREINDTQFKFDWLLDSKVCSVPGKITFSIEFIGYNDKKEFYCWNTLPSYLFVSDGLDVDSIIEQPTASWIQSWNIQADKYLRDFMKYSREMEENLSAIMKLVSDSIKATDEAKAYALSASNSATIAYTEAERAKFYSQEAAQSLSDTNVTKADVIGILNTFNSNINSFRKKNDPIVKNDLSIPLQNEINGKADISNVRLNSIPINENDLDFSLMQLIHNGGSGSGSGGIVIGGVEIDDITPSHNKAYSSSKVENRLATEINSAISSIDLSASMTPSERRKLASIENSANNYTHPLYHPPEIINETTDKQFISQAQKDRYENTYTKPEVDNIISGLATGIIWQPVVPTFADILTTYPNPKNNWAVQTNNDGSFLYDGTRWIKFGNGTVPMSSPSSDGLMSSADYVKLSGLNNYVHPASHAATMIAEDNRHRFVTQSMYDAINDIDNTISNALTLGNFRKNTDKILESDLDTTIIQKIETASGQAVDDNVVSTSKAYSSAKIESLINDVVNDTATANDIDVLFSNLFPSVFP